MQRDSFRRSAFAEKLLQHARRDRAVREGLGQALAPPMFSRWTDGVYPPLADEALRMVRDDAVRLHSHVAAVNSSMVFGFNLFLPYRVYGADALSSALSAATGRTLRADAVHFEYGPSDILAETRSDPPSVNEPMTKSDVAIEVQDVSGERGIILIEVKLSEDGFTPCGGRESRSNGRRDVCGSARTFFDDPSACYLRRPGSAVRDRRYWSIFSIAHGSVRDAFPRAELTSGCPFAHHHQQPMRNHALALGLVQAGAL